MRYLIMKILILLIALIGGCTAAQFPYPYQKPIPEDFYVTRLTSDLPFFESEQYFLQTYKQALLGKANASDEFAVGIAYLQGKHITRNENQAIYWIRKSAEKQYPEAMRYLGLLYMYGVGVPMDFTQVVFWLSKATDLGDSEAMLTLGLLYEAGYGIPKDRSKGLYLIGQSSKLGNRNADKTLDNIRKMESFNKNNINEAAKNAQPYMPPGY